MSAQAFQRLESTHQQVQRELAELDAMCRKLLEQMATISERHRALHARVSLLEGQYANLSKAGGGRPTGSPGGVPTATQHMLGLQQFLNLHYLQLQSQMQHENRNYMAISNLLKKSHGYTQSITSNMR